ncbi:MAG: class I SAM-dependent methyltransferase [Acetobacteraceae bacterium]|nr:class I SAM-dependent methyltransferase [Acetobacteraceae bacterium]
MTDIQAHNTRAATVWSSGGSIYDGVSRSLAEAIEHAVRRLDPKPGEKHLDVATGTGWASRRLAEAGAAVIGTDIAEGLLDAARSEARRQGLVIDYQIGDAEAMPFADGQFDGIVSTFGVMFVSRPEAAAAELARLVRPGGRVVLSTWQTDSTLFEMFQVMRPFMPAPPAGATPPPSPFAWGAQARVRELLGGAFDLGFETGVCTAFMPDGAAFWELFSTGYGPTKMLAESLDPVRRAELQAAFTAFHERFRTDLGIAMGRQYLITHGVRR